MRYRVITVILARPSPRQHPRGGRHGYGGGSLPSLRPGQSPRHPTGGNDSCSRRPGFRRLRHRPGTIARPGWVSGRRHPRRCGEISEAKASPARAPPRHGRLRRPEPHPSAAPGIGAIPLPFPRPADPYDGRVRRPVPHRQNYVGGYVFSHRLSGQTSSNRARRGAGPALTVSHSIRIFALKCVLFLLR
jgi:hypothetical protein